MRVYLASPQSQVQAHACNGMPVLVSYANYSNWMDQYFPSYGRVLIDSGAFSELTGAKQVDVEAYCEWAKARRCDAFAGLDDIGGDWRRSLENYKHGGFPTIHDSDPPELLDDLIALAVDRGKWIGIGLVPPREGKEFFIRSVLERVPKDFHVHGWALRRYTHLARLDSVDSTNWWRDGMKLRTELPFLSYGECLDLIVKRYQREQIVVEKQITDLSLFDHLEPIVLE